MTCLHATCVALGDSGVLLRGEPGSGKSDLALRLLDAGGYLVADDQVLVRRSANAVIAQAPASLRGLLEVRGLGIVRAPARSEVQVSLVVDLTPTGQSDRLPAPGRCSIEGIALPQLQIAPHHASAAAVVRVAVRTLEEGGSLTGALGDAAPLTTAASA